MCMFCKADSVSPSVTTHVVNYKDTIITAEVPSGGLSTKNPNRNAKIPDVAKAFGVRTNNLYYMMRQLGIKI